MSSKTLEDAQTGNVVKETGVINTESSPENENNGNIVADGNKDVNAASKRNKHTFYDCALVEIIHLHDCLRGALKTLENDVHNLIVSIENGEGHKTAVDLQGRVVGRFNVIWSVFQAHSKAEDEFIWPALQSKTQGRICGSPCGSPKHVSGDSTDIEGDSCNAGGGAVDGANKTEHNVIEQEEYEEDHENEEIMFAKMDKLLTKLRSVLGNKIRKPPLLASVLSASSKAVDVFDDFDSVEDIARKIFKLSKTLSAHLHEHLEKEEVQCMPLIAKHLSKQEIDELVGKIMGKRSSDTIAQIMTMAVQNLNDHDREEMVKHMKEAMAGTFFDRWLIMSGWMSSPDKITKDDPNDASKKNNKRSPSEMIESGGDSDKRKKTDDSGTSTVSSTQDSASANVAAHHSLFAVPTSQVELEKLIRAVASNAELSDIQKNTTIQGLRASVYKSNQKKLRAADGSSQSALALAPLTAATNPLRRRTTAPSAYWKKNSAGRKVLIWSSDSPSSICPIDGTVPFFSAEELAPTYHDGAAGAVAGCPHYARKCKLRHPKSGRLYTCRLCCDQVRDMPNKEKDEKLDRYSVEEVMCMSCNTLQPADKECVNSGCPSQKEKFAKYFCRICNLYDDRSRGPNTGIFHCPYCNTCRSGLGLGIDYRHCMRCNACVSLADKEHRCIPQKLQGTCPICRESMFQSTEPLRGLKCGHVMHLSCFNMHRQGSYTCPLCMRSMDDMSEHFRLLDAAVRMQPMPVAYLATRSNIYCQDCGKSGQVPYHFVGQKCGECGSYNTREMGRVTDHSQLQRRF